MSNSIISNMTEVIIPQKDVNEINENDLFKMMDLYFNKEYKLYEYVYNSFNYFMDVTLKRILIENKNIFYEHFNDNKLIRYRFEFSKIKIRPPTIEQENRYMFPNDARDLNVTYSAKITATVSQIKEVIDIMTDTVEEQLVIGKTENDVPITNIPILVRSKYCSLNQKKGYDNKECKYDPGCHFIVKGNEKVVISLERMCENKPFVSIKKDGQGVIYGVQITSKSHEQIGFSQIVSIKMQKNNTLQAKIPIFNDIPALVLFKVLGVETDHDIMNTIVYDEGDVEMVNLVRLSLDNLVNDKNKPIITSRDAKEFLISKLKVVNKIKYNEADKDTKNQQKEMHLMSLLDNNFLPHITKGRIYKAYFLGFMINKLLQTVLKRRPPDDRDSFVNKRIDLVGNLMEELFRQYYKKMLHDCSKFFKKRNDSDVNPMNIINQIKPNIIEQGLTAALSTGQWIKKKGVAQMLARLTYLQTISFYRRVDAPNVDATTTKLTGPRHYHTSSTGFLCCLTGDTNILLDDGTSTNQIKNIRDGDNVMTFNTTNGSNEESKIHNYFSKDYEELYEVTTISAKSIKCSGDHPILVYKDNEYKYVNAYKLKQGDLLVTTYVNDFIPNDKDNNVIFEWDGESDDKTQDKLDILNLLDIKLTDSKLEIIARLLGATNSRAYLENTDYDNYTCYFLADNEKDAQSIVNDIMRLGFDKPSIELPILNGDMIEVKTDYHFAYFMYLIGGIVRNKKEIKTSLPDWIKTCSKNVKREFLSALQGGTGGSFLTHYEDQYISEFCFGSTDHQIIKDQLEDNIKYIQDICDMFAEFDIRSRITIVNESFNDKTNDKLTVSIHFDQDYATLLKYGNIIGYRYCHQKNIDASFIVEYLRYKRDVHNPVTDFITNDNFMSFMTYTNFMKKYYVKDDKMHIPIKSINKIKGEMTYDFTTESSNHNFIANGIVVSNCVETPEHAKVGLTKHLTLAASIAIMQQDQIPVLRELLNNNIDDITSVPVVALSNYTKVFLNGEWLGITNDSIKLVKLLKDMKLNNQISNTAGITHNIRDREIKVYCDGGRMYRPMLCVENNKLVISKKDIERISLDVSQKEKITDWDQFMVDLPGRVEYVDVEEQEQSMVAPRISNVKKMHKRMITPAPKVVDNLIDNRYDDLVFVRYQYSDIHPSFLLSTIATNIVFINHNQGPRNIFQYAQGKQAMGIYATNFRHRLDKSFILYHPMKPLITTRTSKYTSLDQLPCGENCVVAIASYTG